MQIRLHAKASTDGAENMRRKIKDSDYNREAELTKLEDRIYELLQKAGVTAKEAKSVMYVVNKKVMENAKI